MTTELQQMKRLRGRNFFRADPSFGQLLDELAPPEQRDALKTKLEAFAQRVSNEWDALSEEAALEYDGPWIKPYDHLGNRIDEVCLPPPIRRMRREVVEAGIFENDSQLEQFAKVYLLAHLGESCVTCPLACTEGLIRAVEGVGSDFLKEHYLPRLRSSTHPLAGAQFITEQDMGSDVGALTTTATPVTADQWRLEGEKWFCSAIDEYFLIAARPEGASDGTEGVAVFLVPRTLDGKLNGIRIKRLKDKVGSRELPTAEIELDGAIGYNIGPVDTGFKTLMNYVLNTSRIMNAASALGCMARASLEARNYTEQRSAFGQKIIEFPMVRESLEKIQATLAAHRALYFKMLARIDANLINDVSSDEALWRRFLINLCKYRSALGATECTHEAALQLGGNGTIESFSILPRLYRDSLVIETWEGSHNTLCLQICRDAHRFPFKDALEAAFRDADPAIQECWQETAPLLDNLKDLTWTQTHARHLVDRLGSLLEWQALQESSSAELTDCYRKQIVPSLQAIPSL